MTKEQYISYLNADEKNKDRILRQFCRVESVRHEMFNDDIRAKNQKGIDDGLRYMNERLELLQNQSLSYNSQKRVLDEHINTGNTDKLIVTPTFVNDEDNPYDDSEFRITS